MYSIFLPPLKCETCRQPDDLGSFVAPLAGRRGEREDARLFPPPSLGGFGLIVVISEA